MHAVDIQVLSINIFNNTRIWFFIIFNNHPLSQAFLWWRHFSVGGKLVRNGVRGKLVRNGVRVKLFGICVMGNLLRSDVKGNLLGNCVRGNVNHLWCPWTPGMK
ncbi:hypothetical protein ACOMHN_055233 [Nucella lapillus]